MRFGNLEIEIHPDMKGSGCIQINVSMDGTRGHIRQLHNRDTLSRNYEEEDARRRQDLLELLEE